MQREKEKLYIWTLNSERRSAHNSFFIISDKRELLRASENGTQFILVFAPVEMKGVAEYAGLGRDPESLFYEGYLEDGFEVLEFT